MKKTVLTIALAAALALPGQAGGIIVHDPIHTLMNQGNWLITEIKQGLQYEKQLEQYIAEHTTALKEVQQVENEIVQLERMGDPKSFGANLPGVGVITGMAQIYQQGKQDAEDWASFANLQTVKLTAEQVMGLYSNSLTGLTTSNGFHVPSAQGLIQFSLSDYNTAQGAQDSIEKLIAAKTSLTQARDTAIAQMKAATSQSEVQKDHALIDSLNGAIAGVDGQIQQAVQTANLQEQKNQAAAKVYEAGVTVQSVNTLNVSVKTEIGTMESLATGYGDAPHWGGN
jgi:hypothetical protein